MKTYTGLARRTRSKSVQREQRLMPIGWALAGVLTTGLIVTCSVVYIGLSLLHFRQIQRQPIVSSSTLFDLLKIGFAVTAGIGGVVALVTAYRKQRIAEFAHKREEAKLFNERFATAATQLGHESTAVRLAGAHAMAGLADDWPDQRQTCVDVLCAYLRIPYELRPPGDAPDPIRLAWESAHEVRHTIMRIISNHLEGDDIRIPNIRSWRDINLELSGAMFDGGEFIGSQFNGGTAFFNNARFGGAIDFTGAKFIGPVVFFENAQFLGDIDFTGAEFGEGAVSFTGSRFTSGTVTFAEATFEDGMVSFMKTKFEGGDVDFTRCNFIGSYVSFAGALFRSGEVTFSGALFGKPVRGKQKVLIGDEEFEAGIVDFSSAQFAGSDVSFEGARFEGGIVDFSEVSDWSVRPRFDSWQEQPTALSLPDESSPQTNG